MENSVTESPAASPSAPSVLDLLARFRRGEATPVPMAEAIGMRLVEVESGRAVFDLEVDLTRHANPMGTLHGGVLCTLADSAMGMAYAAALGENETFATLELKINFLRPMWRGHLTATGRVVQAGRSVGLTECDVVDEQGRLVARASSTCMTLRGEQGSGR
jgi:uncharacterized protein (TIGR00369 family)